MRFNNVSPLLENYTCGKWKKIYRLIIEDTSKEALLELTIFRYGNSNWYHQLLDNQIICVKKEIIVIQSYKLKKLKKKLKPHTGDVDVLFGERECGGCGAAQKQTEETCADVEGDVVVAQTQHQDHRHHAPNLVKTWTWGYIYYVLIIKSCSNNFKAQMDHTLFWQ